MKRWIVLFAFALGACSHLDQGQLSDRQLAALKTQIPYASLDAVLKEHTDQVGRIDYAALRQTPDELRVFTAAIASAGPQTRPDLFPTPDHSVAYYINAYNALAILNVLPREDFDNLSSFSSKVDFFKLTRSTVDGIETSLDHLEHGIIRPRLGELYVSAKRGSKFGRIHFALNCVSASCPVLPAEAFLPDQVDVQLEREARSFVLEDRNVSVDVRSKTVWLSKIFEWFEEDLWNDEGQVIPILEWINLYRPPDRQIDTGFAIEFRDYDWTLNAQGLERPGVTTALSDD